MTREKIADEHCASSAVPYYTTFETGVPIASLAISPDRTRAAVVGREIFKILQVTPKACVEEHDVHSAVRTAATKEDAIGVRIPTHLAIKDVEWPHGAFDRKLVAAAANGQILVYDLGKDCYDWARLHQHNRQVHTLSSNHFEAAYLLSGSQDSTVRLWDLRNARVGGEAHAMQSSLCFQGNSDAVRHVAWCPKNWYEFAIGTDGRPNAKVGRVKSH